MFVACRIGCLADVSNVSPSSEQTQSAACSDEGLTLKTSAKHHIPQSTNIPYQPLLIKPIKRAQLDARSTKRHTHFNKVSRHLLRCFVCPRAAFALLNMKSYFIARILQQFLGFYSFYLLSGFLLPRSC